MTYILINSDWHELYNIPAIINLENTFIRYNDDNDEEDNCWEVTINDVNYYIYDYQYKIISEEEYNKLIKEKEEKLKSLFYKKSQVEPLVKQIFNDAYFEGSEERYDFTIHFPVINITNSNNKSHVITDLYFKTDVTFSDKLSIVVSGARGSATPAEIYSNYGHSHLHGGLRPCSFGLFCLGASDFKVLIQSLELDPQEYLWEMYLYSIEKYLSWESLEGGPYNKLQNITFKERDSNITSKIFNECKRLLKLIPEDNFNFIESLKLESSNELERFYEENSLIRSEKTNISKDIYKEYENCDMYIGKKIYFKVIREQDKEEKFDKNLVTTYNNIINNWLNNYSKKLKYEYAIKNSKFKPSQVRISK